MSSKKPNTSGNQLKVLGISIRRPASVPSTPAEGMAYLDLYVEVENTANHELYVWTRRRAYSYDPSTHTLTVHLAEPPETVPSHIKMLSDHPRTPAQSIVNAKSRVTIEVQVPATTRRIVPGQGLGKTFVEDPIGQIDRVKIHIQHAAAPIQYRTGESPGDFRTRLQAHGDVTTVEITPTIEKEQ